MVVVFQYVFRKVTVSEGVALMVMVMVTMMTTVIMVMMLGCIPMSLKIKMSLFIVSPHHHSLAQVGFFLHNPWPSSEVFKVFVCLFAFL